MNLSVVCPFFNESLILDRAIERLLNNLGQMDCSWELIIVNDGSTDGSLAIAERWAAKEPRLQIISYAVNQGRGHALKQGIQRARGDVIATTEIDLSWGDDIIYRLYDHLASNPQFDFVVASPNLKGGGYKRVPPARIRMSRLGNKVMRLFFSFGFTMFTGMTRAYRRGVIQGIRTREKEKEFHLEVLLKLTALGFRGGEIPAVIEWQDHKLSQNRSVKRKSSSKVNKLVRSHLRFAVFANPLRYFWALALAGSLSGVACMLMGLVRLVLGEVAIFYILLGLLLLTVSLIFFGFGIITAQNRFIMEEIWLSRDRP